VKQRKEEEKNTQRLRLSGVSFLLRRGFCQIQFVTGALQTADDDTPPARLTAAPRCYSQGAVAREEVG
jgi:hypothetical protein